MVKNISWKQCSTCEEAKPKTEFYKKTATADGLHYKCKSCVRAFNIINAENIKRSRDKYLAKKRGRANGVLY